MKVLKLLLTFSLVSTTLVWGASSQYFNTEVGYYDAVDVDSVAVEDVALWNEEDTVWNEEDTVYVDEEYVEYWHSFDDNSTFMFCMINGTANPLVDVTNDLEAENYKKILADAEVVLREYPRASDAQYYAAYASYCLKDYKKAIELATDLCAEYPTYNNVCNLLHMVGDKDERYMFSLLKKRIEEREAEDYYYPLESAAAIDIMAQKAKEYGYLVDAIGYLDKLENKMPSLNDVNIGFDVKEYFDPLMRKVVAYTCMDEYNVALQLLESMSEDDRDETWYLNKFCCLRGANGLESALKFEQETLEKYPEVISFLKTNIIDLTLAGKYDEAIAQADKLIESESTEPEGLPELYLRRGVAKKLSGNKEDAEKDFLKTIEVANNYDNGPLTIAKCHLGMKEEVLKNLNEANGEAFLAAVYNVLGMTDKALEKLGEAYEECSCSPIRSKYDINHQSLLSHPSFPKIAKQFQPQKRRL